MKVKIVDLEIIIEETCIFCREKATLYIQRGVGHPMEPACSSCLTQGTLGEEVEVIESRMKAVKECL